MVSMPRCGCQGNPAAWSFGLSLRKSSSKRNGSNSFVLPKPKARCNLTPAPSMVGLGSIIWFPAISDIELLRAWYDSLCPIRRSSDTSSLHKLHLECDGDLLAHQNAASFK